MEKVNLHYVLQINWRSVDCVKGIGHFSIRTDILGAHSIYTAFPIGRRQTLQSAFAQSVSELFGRWFLESRLNLQPTFEITECMYHVYMINACTLSLSSWKEKLMAWEMIIKVWVRPSFRCVFSLISFKCKKLYCTARIDLDSNLSKMFRKTPILGWFPKTTWNHY